MYKRFCILTSLEFAAESAVLAECEACIVITGAVDAAAAAALYRLTNCEVWAMSSGQQMIACQFNND